MKHQIIPALNKCYPVELDSDKKLFVSKSAVIAWRLIIEDDGSGYVEGITTCGGPYDVWGYMDENGVISHFEGTCDSLEDAQNYINDLYKK